MKRIYEIRVKVSKEEKEQIDKKAVAVGLLSSTYLRLSALKPSLLKSES